MSRIIQASKRKDLIRQEKKVRITQWRFIKPTLPEGQGEFGLEVCVGYDVYFIHNMSIWTFHKINHKNIDVIHVFEYVRSALICTRCGGTGIIDWIDKATPARKTNVINLNDVLKYVRNKKGIVNILSDFGDFITYTSTPAKRVGENFCPSCYGCGIRLSTLSHDGTKIFNPS